MKSTHFYKSLTLISVINLLCCIGFLEHWFVTHKSEVQLNMSSTNLTLIMQMLCSQSRPRAAELETIYSNYTMKPVWSFS